MERALEAGATDFAVAPNASPDGGTWVGLGINGSYVERFGQVLNGLTIGQTYTVMWRHQDKPALDSTPLFFFDNPEADDLYQVTAKFMVTE